MYNIQTFYGWQTQYKCVMSTHKYFTNTHKCVHIQPRNTQRTFRKLSTFAHEIHSEHTVRRRGPIHRARIFLLPFHILLQTKSEKSKAGNPKNNK